MTEKRCSTCKEWKLYSEFGRNKRAKDGHCCYCKICNNTRSRKYREDNPEILREIDRKYRTANIERYNQYKQKWDEINKDRVNEYRKKHQKANAEKYRAHDAKRRALKISTSTIDPWELQQISLFYGECPDGYHVDHILPLVLGGRHELSNLQHLEARLNLNKKDKHPDDWDDPRPISCRA